LGYEIVVINAESFEPSVCKKHNLAPEGVLDPLATNHRVIIFAKKLEQAKDGSETSGPPALLASV
jgi:hypothetical protein